MPQIWLTYEELGSFIELSPMQARDYVSRNLWDRRRSRDGLTRVKLPISVARLYAAHWIAEQPAAPNLVTPGTGWRYQAGLPESRQIVTS